MTQPAKSQEPSMEEILASIRRIIADDDASKSPAKPAETPRPASRGAASPRGAQPVSPPAEPQRGSSAIEADDEDLSVSGVQDPDILDLTESMAVPAFKEQTQMSQPASVEKFQDHSQSEDVESELVEQDVSEVEEELSFGPVPSPELERMEAARVGVPGVSERGQLLSGATSAAVDSAFNALAQTVLVHNARTLEDLVREMLRPMLKTWLDDNLPGLVERLVRAEIERVARGR